MNYCSIDEAWGNNIFKDSRKKRKTKRLYTTPMPPHIYDRSYEEGSKDAHCVSDNKKQFTVKNKQRFDKSRGPKDIYRPKRSSRVDNINVRYDEANQEYKKYKKETKRNCKNKLNREEIIENDFYPPSFSNNMDYIDGDEVGEYSPIQENDIDLAPIPSGNNLSETYILEDNDKIQNRMFQLQQEQNNTLEEQRQQVDQQGLQNNIEQFDNYYQNNNIEAFEGNGNELDAMMLEEDNEDRINEINDVDTNYAPSPIITPERNSNNSNSSNNNNKKNKKNKKNNNFLDNLLTKEPESEEDDSDSENEEELEVLDDESNDLEYRLNTLHRNVNLIIKKMNHSNFFEEDAQENIHDLILFVLFGIFIIFVLDTIYRFGKQSRGN